MKATSLMFIVVCAIPLFGVLFYLLKSDKAKKHWGILLLGVLFILAFLAIATLTKDFAPA